MKLIILILFFPLFSHAYLGQQKQTPKSRIATNESVSSYSVFEVKIQEVLVKEFSNASGQVFAVTWMGMSHPDLESLLGSYWPEYKLQKRQSVRRLQKRTTKTNSIIVEKSGKMREVSGRAFVPILIPVGVDPYELN